MNRRDFLKSIGLGAFAAVVPLSITDDIEWRLETMDWGDATVLALRVNDKRNGVSWPTSETTPEKIEWAKEALLSWAYS